MKTLLDELLSLGTHGNGCGCSSSINARHTAGCGCPRCRRRKRSNFFRQLRPGGLLDMELENENNFASINAYYGIEDWTQQARTSDCTRQRGFNCRSGARPLTQIDSIILHQTAGSTSTDPNRFLSIPIHYVVLSNGRILQLYPETDYINHAGSFNRWSVGIEFAGTFANDRGQCWMGGRYVNRGNTSRGITCGEPTAAQIAAGRRLVTAISQKVPTVRWVLAHRQSTSSRTNDPGPSIWLQVGEWAKRNLPFGIADNYYEGTGKTIPDSWKQGTITP